MRDAGNLLTVASIIAGFGVAVLMFRIQRELDVREKRPTERNWLAWADYLVIGAVLISLLLVVVPLVVVARPPDRLLDFAAGAAAAAAILLSGYPLAILDHYRIEIGANRTGKRYKGEPIERVLVISASIIAGAVFVVVLLAGQG